MPTVKELSIPRQVFEIKNPSEIIERLNHELGQEIDEFCAAKKPEIVELFGEFAQTTKGFSFEYTEKDSTLFHTAENILFLIQNNGMPQQMTLSIHAHQKFVQIISFPLGSKENKISGCCKKYDCIEVVKLIMNEWGVILENPGNDKWSDYIKRSVKDFAEIYERQYGQSVGEVEIIFYGY